MADKREGEVGKKKQGRVAKVEVREGTAPWAGLDVPFSLSMDDQSK